MGRGEVEDVPRVEEEEADGGMGGGHSSTTNTHKTHYYYQTKGRDEHEDDTVQRLLTNDILHPVRTDLLIPNVPRTILDTTTLSPTPKFRIPSTPPQPTGLFFCFFWEEEEKGR